MPSKSQRGSRSEQSCRAPPGRSLWAKGANRRPNLPSMAGGCNGFPRDGEKSHLDQEAQASGARSAGNRCRSRFKIQLSKT